MRWFLLLFCFFHLAASQNCTDSDKLCQACVGTKQDNLTTITRYLYTEPFCSKLFILADHNNANNTVKRCKEYFSSVYDLKTECQLPVFTDYNLTSEYAEAGLRSAAWTYYIGMIRGDNCSSIWYYEGANGQLTANRNSSSACNYEAVVFEGMQVKEVDPTTYMTNSFLCQCALRMEDLPGTSKSGTGNSGSSTIAFATTILIVLFSSSLYLQ